MHKTGANGEVQIQNAGGYAMYITKQHAGTSRVAWKAAAGAALRLYKH